mgnify:FL=1
MLSKEDKRIAYRRIEEIRRNPPKITREHWDHADKLLKQNEAEEAKKDKDIKGELKDLSKDLSGFVYNQISGVGKIFHGIGEGKKSVCSVCEQHESRMYNMKDGKWYCQEHRWLGNLKTEQQEKERSCLSIKHKQM